jgi:hypothetical protein
MERHEGSAFLLPSRLGQLGSPFHRRELWNYLQYVLRRGDIGAMVTASRGLSQRAAAGRWPAEFGLEDRWQSDPSITRAIPVALSPHRVQTAGDTIQLATRTWDLAGGPPWTAVFDDPEDTYAAHRFGWMLPHLHDGSGAARGAALAAAWITSHAAREGAAGWDSYSVAERIVNWTYLIAARDRDGAESAFLLPAIADHAQWLADHLEFRGSATNNHLINDARALYIAGVLLGHEGFAHLARQLLAFGIAHMFVGGFLREGSTHYQRLMCRTYAEMLIAARAGRDHRFAEQVAGWLEEITSALEFLPTGRMFPLIGDTSPDFPPDHHAAVTDLARRLLNSPKRPCTAATAALAGYHRLDGAAWSVLAFVNPSGHVPAWSHAHADVGAFVASWEGRPVLVDAGRATYRKTPLGEYGRSVRSHNGVALDRHEPCVAHGLNGFVPVLQPSYYQRRTHAFVSDTDSTIRIENDGFRRLSSVGTFVRTVHADGGQLAVRDEVQGSGRRRIETFFHFHPGVRVNVEAGPVVRAEVPESGTLVMTCPASARVEHLRGQSSPELAGLYSARYGSVEPCSTVIITADVRLPHRQQFELCPA